jgi:hypothetical protein
MLYLSLDVGEKFCPGFWFLGKEQVSYLMKRDIGLEFVLEGLHDAECCLGQEDIRRVRELLPDSTDTQTG